MKILKRHSFRKLYCSIFYYIIMLIKFLKKKHIFYLIYNTQFDLPMDKGIMGFSGLGLIFRASTMFRMRLWVLRASLEDLTCHPERRPLPLTRPLPLGSSSLERRSCDWSCSSASASSTASQLGVWADGESGESLGLRLGQLTRLGLLWNRLNWLSLATLLGIITRQEFN